MSVKPMECLLCPSFYTLNGPTSVPSLHLTRIFACMQVVYCTERKRHLVANTRDGEGPLYPSSAPVVKAMPELLCLYSDHRSHCVLVVSWLVVLYKLRTCTIIE